jgi:hypothetical protein
MWSDFFSSRFGLNFYVLRPRVLYSILIICRPSDSAVPEDAGIEPRTKETLALVVWSSYHLALMNLVHQLCKKIKATEEKTYRAPVGSIPKKTGKRWICVKNGKRDFFIGSSSHRHTVAVREFHLAVNRACFAISFSKPCYTCTDRHIFTLCPHLLFIIQYQWSPP